MSLEDIKEMKIDVKELRKDIGDIKSTLAVNTGTLQVHIKRTELNEKRIQKVENWLLGFLAAILIAIIGNSINVVLSQRQQQPQVIEVQQGSSK